MTDNNKDMRPSPFAIFPLHLPVWLYSVWLGAGAWAIEESLQTKWLSYKHVSFTVTSLF